MARNKRTFYYAQYLRTEDVMDEYGNPVGHRNVYADPVKAKANYSPARGETESMIFGNPESYDRVIVADKSMPRLTEQSLLWIGREPANGEHNYIVKQVADSQNGFLYAIKQVDVSA